MDIRTIETMLSLAKTHMTDAKYNAFLIVTRKTYIQSEITMREDYLGMKVQNAAIRAQYQKDLTILKKQLAAL